MNQKISHIMISCIIIIILFTGLITATPVQPIHKTNEYSMLDAVLIQCPNLKDNNKFKEQSVFKTCKNNWTVITNTSVLEDNTMDKVLCLLYYDTVIEVCKNDNLLSLDEEISKFSTERDVCKNFTTLLHTRTFEHNLSALITDEFKCQVLCYGFSEKLNELCRYSYFFASYDTNKKTSEASNKGVSSDNVQQSVQVQQLQDLSSSNVVNEHNLETVQKTDVQLKKADIVQPNTGSKVISKLPDAAAAVVEGNNDLKKPLETSNNAAPKEIKDNPAAAVPKDNPADSKQEPLKSKQESVVKPPVDIKDATKQASPPAEPSQVQAEVDATSPKQTDVGMDDMENAMDMEFPDEQQEKYDQQDVEIESPEKYTQPEKKNEKPSTLEDEPVNINNTEYDLNGDSYFLSYFTVAVCLFFVGYVGYHNRQKIMALLLEGKKRPRQHRVGRRPNSANYHKLDSNLEEAISSSCNKSTSHVIY